MDYLSCTNVLVMTDQRGRGRPPVESPRSERVTFRVSVSERDLLRDGLSEREFSEWLRQAALAAARRRVRQAQKDR